jgi:histidine ammonia-lyase
LQPLQTTEPLQRVHALIRRNVAYRPYDHRLDRDIATLAALIDRRELTGFVT